MGTTSTCSTSVPAGAHLFLISNVGRTVRVLGLAGGQLLPDPCVLPDFDPVGLSVLVAIHPGAGG